MSRPISLSRPGLRSAVAILEKEDETRGLFESLALSERAGSVLAPLLKPYHLMLDFSKGACRVEGNVLVLLPRNAVQLNRLRNLKTRILAALASAGLPLTELELRIVPPPEAEPAPPPPPPHRPPSLLGAAAIRSRLEEIENEALRETLSRLANALHPPPEETKAALLAALRTESARLDAAVRLLAPLERKLPDAIDPALLPEADLEALAPLRERLLARIARRAEALERLTALRRTNARLALELERIRLALELEGDSSPAHDLLAALEGDFLAVHAAIDALTSEVAAFTASLEAVQASAAPEAASAESWPHNANGASEDAPSEAEIDERCEALFS